MRSYLLIFTKAASATLLAIALVNWVVDPYAIYGTPRVAGFNEVKHGITGHARIWKTIVTRREPWQALVIGTSRAEMGIDCGHPLFHGRRCFNAATGGQTSDEGLRLVQEAARGGALEQVVAVLDFAVYNSNYAGAPDLDEDNFRPWRPVAIAFNTETLVQSLFTPLRQDTRALLLEHGVWDERGRYESPPAFLEGHRTLTLRSEGEYLRVLYFPAPRRTFELSGNRHFDSYRDLVALAHARGVALTLVISPTHARHAETVAVAGLWPQWEDWERRVVAINEEEARRAGRPAFPLWDFSGYNAVTTDPFPPLGDHRARMNWYLESSHFTKAAGDMALDRILAADAGRRIPNGFGSALTSANLEAHLTSTRAARLEWRAAHPADVAEIEALQEKAVA